MGIGRVTKNFFLACLYLLLGRSVVTNVKIEDGGLILDGPSYISNVTIINAGGAGVSIGSGVTLRGL